MWHQHVGEIIQPHRVLCDKIIQPCRIECGGDHAAL